MKMSLKFNFSKTVPGLLYIFQNLQNTLEYQFLAEVYNFKKKNCKNIKRNTGFKQKQHFLSTKKRF